MGDNTGEFRQRAEAFGTAAAFFEHPMSGGAYGKLETGTLRYGNDKADTVIFLTSGIHGVEQPAGSWCQFDLIDRGTLDALPKGVAVVVIHQINPWAAAAGRRYTEDNVDMCRNFVDFTGTLPETPKDYVSLQPLFDAAPEAARDADEELEKFAKAHGVTALYAAAMGGQYSDPNGVGFGGQGPTWSRRTLEQIMLHHASGAKRVYTLDYHTGIGPYAYGCIVGMQTGARLRRAREVFGPWIFAPRENPPEGFIDVTGHSGDGYEALFPRADVMAGVLEVGTYPQDVYWPLLLAEHRATRTHGPDSDHPQMLKARQALADYYIPSDPYWRDYVHQRGLQAFAQTLEHAIKCTLHPASTE